MVAVQNVAFVNLVYDILTFDLIECLSQQFLSELMELRRFKFINEVSRLVLLLDPFVVRH